MGGFNSGQHPNPALNRRVTQLRARGPTFGQIGARLGITRQRAQQIHAAVRNGTYPARRKRPLTLAQIERWASSHYLRTGCWPTQSSGAVTDAPGETWQAIDGALRRGCRGLPGGSSLIILLAGRPGFFPRPRRHTSRLTIPSILRWADAHHARTEHWPMTTSGPVIGGNGETWSGISQALTQGFRGLPGGSSLFQLLKKRRQVGERRGRRSTRKC